MNLIYYIILCRHLLAPALYLINNEIYLFKNIFELISIKNTIPCTILLRA